MSAYELFNSRSVSQRDVTPTMRTRWLVQLADTDDPALVSPLDDVDLPIRGSGHAYLLGPIVRARDVVEHLNVRSFIVEVSYEAPAALIPTYGRTWQTTVSGSLESRRRLVERFTDSQIQAGYEPRVIGSNQYREVQEGETATHSTKTVDEDGNQTTLSLIRLQTRVPEGVDLTEPVATLNLKRHFEGSINQEGLLARLNDVNSDVFYGAPPGSLKFSSANIVSVLPFQPTGDGLAYDVDLGFSWKSDQFGWQPVLVHTYKTDDGFSSVVNQIEPPAPMAELFTGYFASSFNGLLSIV